MLDEEIAALHRRRDEAGIVPTFVGGPSATVARARYAAFQALIPRPTFPVAATTETSIPGRRGAIAVTVVRPHRPSGHTVAYFHGGGFVVGSVRSHLDHAARIAAGTGAVVVSVEYALAPERPFPAAWEDAVDVVEHVLANPEIGGGRADLVAVAGDSAGGNLATNVALHCRDAGHRLVGQLLLYPATDLVRLAGIPTHSAVNALYAGPDPARLADPRISPARAESHAGLAPAVIAVGSEDFLLQDNLDYAAALERAGVQVQLLRHDGMPHGFLHLGAVSAAAEVACAGTVAAFADLLER